MDTLTPTIAVNVKTAMDAAKENLLSMERGTGITRDRLRRRLTGKSPWNTSEVAAIAAHLNTTPADLCSEQQPA